MIPLADVALRPMTASDLERVLRWRNAPAVRRMMFTDHEITAGEHARWFAAMTARDDCRLLIAEVRDHGPAGFVSITEIDARHGTCTWGFYADPARPVGGLGSPMLTHALDLAFDRLGVRKLWSETLGGNEPGLALHRRLGFREEGVFREHKIKDAVAVDVVRFAMLNREWPIHRARLWPPVPG